jgi:thioredoxin 1
LEKEIVPMENGERKIEQEAPVAEPAVEPAAPGPERRKNRMPLIFAGGGLILLVGLVLFYFLFWASPSRMTLASVNGEKITVEEFNREVGKLESPYREMYQEDPSQFIEGLMMKRLLLQEAKKQGISPPAKTYKDSGKEALPPEDAMVAELVKKKFSKPPEVTPQEVQEFYATYKDRMEGKKLQEVAAAIEEMIREGKQQEEMNVFLGDLRRNAKIEMNENTIKKIAAKPPESNTEDEFKKALQSGQPVLVDFGSNSCVPCRQLRPILKEVAREHSGKAGVLVIDVYKNEGLAREYKVMLIPTLVFFDSKGKEVFRHVGVLAKEQIVAKLKEIGMAS